MTELKKRPEPTSPNFHARMMNVQYDNATGDTTNLHYLVGHRDARHQCAEIALEADRRTKQLEAALRFYAEPHNYKYGDYESAVIHDAGDIARKALDQ